MLINSLTYIPASEVKGQTGPGRASPVKTISAVPHSTLSKRKGKEFLSQFPQSPVGLDLREGGCVQFWTPRRTDSVIVPKHVRWKTVFKFIHHWTGRCQRSLVGVTKIFSCISFLFFKLCGFHEKNVHMVCFPKYFLPEFDHIIYPVSRGGKVNANIRTFSTCSNSRVVLLPSHRPCNSRTSRGFPGVKSCNVFR